MQGQDTQKNNVVSLFEAREKNSHESANPTGTSAATVPEESFADIMARNARNKERMAKERNSANKSVLRSYRIKH